MLDGPLGGPRSPKKGHQGNGRQRDVGGTKTVLQRDKRKGAMKKTPSRGEELFGSKVSTAIGLYLTEQRTTGEKWISEDGVAGCIGQ